VRLTLVTAVIVWMAMGAGAVPAQYQRADLPGAFEVASVKPNRSTNPPQLRFLPGGKLVATNADLQTLILNAFEIQFFQLQDAPGWVASERFDISAAAADATTSLAGTRLLLRRLLIDRFNLRLRQEKRSLPGYALVVSRPNVLGRQLKPTTLDCAEYLRAARDGTAQEVRRECGVRYGAMGQQMTITLGGAPLPLLVDQVQRVLRRPVIDATGLSGYFDLDLTFSVEALPWLPPMANAPALKPQDERTIFAAIKEDLGLELRGQRVVTDVLVVDAVARPTAD
jgi:uncharacterized protein (TIGR03435 family)